MHRIVGQHALDLWSWGLALILCTFDFTPCPPLIQSGHRHKMPISYLLSSPWEENYKR